MASTVNLDMDTAKDSPIELRDGSITSNTKDVKAPSAESSGSSTLAVEKQKKKKKNKPSKMTNGKKSSLSKSENKKIQAKSKSKSKKGKKVSIVDDKSSSSDDSDTESSSEESTESDEEMKAGSRSKKIKSRKSAKRNKKQSRSTESDSESDDSGAETNDSTGSESTKAGNTQKGLSLVQQQLQLLMRKVQDLGKIQNPAMGMGGLGGYDLGGMALGNGYQANNGGLNTGGLSGNLNHYWNGNQEFGLGRSANSNARGRGRGGRRPPPGRRHGSRLNIEDSCAEEDEEDDYLDGLERSSKSKSRKSVKRRQRLEFKRVDHVWDSEIHNFKLQDTAESTQNSRYDEYLFHVRRTFDWQGKYKATIIDIKSKQLREALCDAMGQIKGVSLVEETPNLDPNLLFLSVVWPPHRLSFTDLACAVTSRTCANTWKTSRAWSPRVRPRRSAKKSRNGLIRSVDTYVF